MFNQCLDTATSVGCGITHVPLMMPDQSADWPVGFDLAVIFNAKHLQGTFLGWPPCPGAQCN